MKALAGLIAFNTDPLFQRPEKDLKSLYEIRNDIAHGNIAHDDRSYLDRHNNQLKQFQPMTREFIIKIAGAAIILSANASRTGSAG